MTPFESIQLLQEKMNASIIGQENIVERLIIGLLSNGNLLVEGLPGLAKTRAVRAMADAIESEFSRIQFTPDLLPSDVTGTENMYEENGEYTFKFEPGPIFGNIILADEINRAPAKVQSAMLEAMEERQITVAGTTHKLPKLFIVMATQNPIEQEGTYPLPEAQKDRFLMHVNIEYPDKASEAQVIELVRAEKSAKKPKEKEDLITQETIFAARDEVAKVQTSKSIIDYIVDLVFATRFPEKYDEKLASYIDVGVSPRASLSLDQTSRTYAWMQGRDYVTPEDVRAVVHDVFRHRITPSYEAQSDRVSNDEIIDIILDLVALPA
ncbi:AAA family ATPase [Sulfurovum sp. NBC37-1]|uniref:AAA family ATPase n=1 Tax=Sulfurovum sp. (strain NBC37-1) TaxID=387093 RepID=UPI0001587A7E|nr:MoxR family ATPase [Sulfurovum sp. NBC37-1]BAF73322.1 ATPase, AAA family [Sulfurovum sp. NBC37-1]